MPPNYRNDVGISYPITPSAQAHIVRFPESDKDVDSAFFKEHFEASAYMCTVSFLDQYVFMQILYRVTTEDAHPQCNMQFFKNLQHFFREI